MATNAKVISYGDKNYQAKKNLFDSIAQVIEDIKYTEVHGGHRWNLPVHEVTGLTARLVDGAHLELTYHRFVNGTYEDLARNQLDEDGKKFIKEVVKQLKKRFKDKTGKALTLKEVDEPQRGYDKTGNIQAETAWMIGSSRYGYGGRAVGRYLVRDSCIYEFSAKL